VHCLYADTSKVEGSSLSMVSGKPSLIFVGKPQEYFVKKLLGNRHCFYGVYSDKGIKFSKTLWGKFTLLCELYQKIAMQQMFF
jgi:hypothetical protein